MEELSYGDREWWKKVVEILTLEKLGERTALV